MLERFGLGKVTGVDLPNEEKAFFHHRMERKQGDCHGIGETVITGLSRIFLTLTVS